MPEVSSQPTRGAGGHYTRVAVILHWLMALAFLLMLASGLILEELKLEPSFKFQLYQWHKSLGIVLLLLFVLRLLWRLTHKPPALPPHFRQWEQRLAHGGHLLLYAGMLLVPLAGWVMVSSSVFGLPTVLFGIDALVWPHIQDILPLEDIEGNTGLFRQARQWHGWLAWSFGALIAVHIAAALKHHIQDKNGFISRMWFRRN